MGCTWTPKWVTDKKLEEYCNKHDSDYIQGGSFLNKILADITLFKNTFCHGIETFTKSLIFVFVGLWFIVYSILQLIGTSLFGWFYWNRS